MKNASLLGGIMTRSNRKFQIPATTHLALKDTLSSRLKELWASAQENSFDLYLFAAGLRERYLDKKQNQYSAEFQDWYKKHEIDKLFGKMPSFTKYAMAGNIVSYFANEFHEGKYINHLPLSRNALYEIWLLKEETTPKELEKLLFSGGDDKEALIHPSASAADIAAYRNPRNAQSQKTTAARSKKYTIALVTIYVSRDLYKFDKGTGEHVGDVDFDDAKKLVSQLSGRLDPKLFDVRDNLKKISSNYEKKMDAASPSRALRKPPKAKSAKKAQKKV
jgi:hypothetical protein